MPRLSTMKCYFGCETKGPFHQFPKPNYPDLERFNSWKMVLNESMQQKGDVYIYNNIRLCDFHFEWYYRSPSKRLTRNAVPTLNTSTTLQSTVLPVINKIIENKNLQEDLQSENQTSVGSTYQQTEIEICGSRTKMNKDLNETAIPAKAFVTPASTYQQIEIEYCGSTTKMNTDLNETTLPAKSCQPKAQTQGHTCREVTQLNLKVQQLQAKCKALKQQVRQARKMSLHKSFLKGVAALPEAAQIFTNMQLSKTLKKSQGRRFTKQEKVLSLTIYKQSEKTYELLHKLFTLPSKRTLQKMLSKEKIIDRNGSSLIANDSHTRSDLLAQVMSCTGIP